MKKHIFSFLFLLSLVFSVSAQEKKAELLDEFSNLPCGHLLARADSFGDLLIKNPNSKIIIIYYEGNHFQQIYDKQQKKWLERAVNPRRGEAKSKTEAITLYLTKYREIPSNRFTLVDGGYDTGYRVEIWLVPNGVELPKPSPTLSEKDVKFQKGKTSPVRDCEGFYRSL